MEKRIMDNIKDHKRMVTNDNKAFKSTAHLVEGKKGFSIDDIKKIAKRINSKYDSKNRIINISLQFTNGRYSTRSTSVYDNELYKDIVTQDYEIFNVPTPYDGYDNNITEDLIPEDGFDSIMFEVIEFKPQKGGKGNNNDCLYYCLNDAMGGRDYMPKSWNTAKKLKARLNISKDDKVATHHLQTIANILKANIHLTGDEVNVYSSSKATRRNIHLDIKDSHYTLRPTQKITKKIKYHKVFKVAKRKKNKIISYDGEKIKRLTTTSVNDLDYHICGKDQNIKEFYEEKKQLQKKMIKAGKKHNIYFCDPVAFMSHKALTLKNFKYYCQSIDYPEDIDNCEYKYLELATSGDIYYCQKNRTTLKKAYKYDINSLYPSLMASIYSVFPTGKPSYKMIDDMPKDFCSFGMYKCKLEQGTADDELFKIIRKNRFHWYTHIDINDLRKYGFKFVLCKDEMNSISYSDVVKGSQVFEPFVNALYKAKSDKTDEEVSKNFKQVLNLLWGTLCQKKVKKVSRERIEKMENFPTMENIKELNMTHLEYVDSKRPYYNNWARIKPFLKAYSRRAILKVITKDELYKHVHHIKVDSLISDIPLNIPISDKLGEWKIEHEGEIEIVHNNKVFLK